ncbi:uncharacterized protein LOC100489417 [Xenopus tropicalis]|uniref:Uncharacterized protein LOC100489417 n=1 Tax=Xenopus tropicalis TaxID=8364 RepID=A0A8J0SAC5_XENTR|nr:uncharacterized protein LOC100489417 [Xenopus tropicalis]
MFPANTSGRHYVVCATRRRSARENYRHSEPSAAPSDMEGRSGRKVKASSRDTSNEKKLFKAIYINRFGKHSSGTVLQYGLRSGDKKVLISVAGENQAKRQHGNLRRSRKAGSKGTASPEIPLLRPKHGSWIETSTNRERGNQHTNVHKWGEHTADINGRHKGKSHNKERKVLDDQFRLKRGEPARHNGTPATCSQNVKLDKHHSVLHVIAKMLEENEQLRQRLHDCSQKCTQ